MSRSIQPVIDAFMEGKPRKISNTETDGKKLWLFGNCIAKWENYDELWISAGGYKPTVTTQDRLNMLGAKVKFSKGKFYINERHWDGKWIGVHDIPQLDIKKEKRESLFN